MVALPSDAQRRKNKGNKEEKSEPFQIDFEKYKTQYPVIHPDSLGQSYNGPDSIFVENDSTFLSGNYLSDTLVELMDTLAKINRRIPFEGYRIVLYTGPDRQKALITKGKAMKILRPQTAVYYTI